MDDVTDRLGRALGGTVTAFRGVSGGASRLTNAFDVTGPSGTLRALILQQQRGDGLGSDRSVAMEAALLRAASRAGVPVPIVLAAGEPDGLDAGWLVVERLEGETIPRRILRRDAYAEARSRLTGDVARALAQIHSLSPQDIPGLPNGDPLEESLELLDETGEVRPILELGARWLAANRPPASGRTVIHGDFRMGNFLVDTTGLCGILDWELAHTGDPAEDLGWLTARAWRFGGSGEVGGFGQLDELLARYAEASGRVIDPVTVRWWQAYASIKWAVICALQAFTHLSGTTRSVELAAIGRRVCESEWDLLGLIGVVRPRETQIREYASATSASCFGRPSARELIEAVEEYLEHKVMAPAKEGARFEALVARNVLGIVTRELKYAPDIEATHRDCLANLGFQDDATLAAAIRAGDLDARLAEVGAALGRSAFDQLRVANPAYVRSPPEDME